MHRDRITLALVSLTLALGAAVSCTDSEPIGPSVNQTGAAGSNLTGAAGSTGAGNMTGTAGTTGAAGSSTGVAGTTGAAGSTTGSAGSGAAGSGNDAGVDSGAATGAAGSSADAGAPVSFATAVYPIIMVKCMPCHTKTAGPDGMLAMSSATAAYTSLLGAAMTGGAAMTNTTCKLLDTKKLRVEPGDPTHSYVYIKITNSDSQLSAQTCGPAMPETASGLTLTTAQKTTIHDWIMGGAKP